MHLLQSWLLIAGFLVWNSEAGYDFMVFNVGTYFRHPGQFGIDYPLQENKTIPFYIDQSAKAPGFLDHFHEARKLLEENTCIRMVEKSTNERGKVHVLRRGLPSERCSASPHSAKYYEHDTTRDALITITEKCQNETLSILHELFHTLSMRHFTEYHDREKYLLSMKMNERKENVTHIVPVDFSSILTYAFAPKDERYYLNIGQRDFVPFMDYYAINKFYNCSDECQGQPPCSSGGYRISNDCSKCVCPPGITGPTCIIASANDCGKVVWATSEFQTVDFQNSTAVGKFCMSWIAADPGKKIEYQVVQNEKQVYVIRECPPGRSPHAECKEALSNDVQIFGHEDWKMSGYFVPSNRPFATNEEYKNLSPKAYSDTVPRHLLRIQTKYPDEGKPDGIYQTRIKFRAVP